jgi:hypothetical protein
MIIIIIVIRLLCLILGATTTNLNERMCYQATSIRIPNVSSKEGQ